MLMNSNWHFSFYRDHKRQRGNFWYERSEFNLAIQLYRRSLEYLDDTDKYVGESSKKEEVNEKQEQHLDPMTEY